MNTSTQTINDLLNRGVVDLEVRSNLESRLKKGDQLRVKLGIDPTGSELHLGHSVILRKMRSFQDAGHQVILLIGTFTGKIGDPTGKDKTRPPLTDQELKENAKDFLQQASKVLDVDKLELRENGEWLAPLNFADVLRLAGSFTVQQMINRKSFKKRIEDGHEISLHEFMYPLMQGYDSVPLKADLELGGTDQLFNLMAGRQIQKKFGQKPQDVMTMPILIGLDGKDKMSKSLDNYIAIEEDPSSMFGKIMSIPDKLMANWFELLTSVPLDEVDKILEGHPRDAKLCLAQEIVTDFHSKQAAQKAQEEFLRVFQDKGVPDDLPLIIVAKGGHSAFDLVALSNLVASNSEIKRLFKQLAISFDDHKISDSQKTIPVGQEEIILQVGKRKFAKIKGG
jgi:tyrosyl-tRNA synthetase